MTYGTRFSGSFAATVSKARAAHNGGRSNTFPLDGAITKAFAYGIANSSLFNGAVVLVLSNLAGGYTEASRFTSGVIKSLASSYRDASNFGSGKLIYLATGWSWINPDLTPTQYWTYLMGGNSREFPDKVTLDKAVLGLPVNATGSQVALALVRRLSGIPSHFYALPISCTFTGNYYQEINGNTYLQQYYRFLIWKGYTIPDNGETPSAIDNDITPGTI